MLKNPSAAKPKKPDPLDSPQWISESTAGSTTAPAPTDSGSAV